MRPSSKAKSRIIFWSQFFSLAHSLVNIWKHLETNLRQLEKKVCFHKTSYQTSILSVFVVVVVVVVVVKHYRPCSKQYSAIFSYH